VRFLVTGAGGFLGWRSATLLAERGHEVLSVVRPGGAERAHSRDLDATEIDAGDPDIRDLVAGRDAVLHFAGVPAPSDALADPARAVRENAGTTLNLLQACVEQGAGLVYPSTLRAGLEPPPDPYALSKRLGEVVCRSAPASAAVVRLTSVFGPGQVAWEGATGAIANFAARALEGVPIVIPGDAGRTRDFVYVDDAVAGFERVVAEGLWGRTLTLASDVPTSLQRAAELVIQATGSSSAIETPGGVLPPGENQSYKTDPGKPGLRFDVRPLEEGIAEYVDWLRRHPAAQGRARA
jgi:nucleoside-diphosphate-sugar epimerase